VALAVTLGAVPRDIDNAHAASVASIVKIGAAALQTPQRVAPRPASVHHVVHKAAHIRTSAAGTPTSIVSAVQSSTSHVVTGEPASADVAASTANKPATNKPATKKPVTKKPATKKPATKKHHKKTSHPKKTVPVKVTPTKAARVKPSASALSGAISGLKQYVHTVFSITSSEVAQFGDEVCSAFDKNESYSAIKSQITAKVKQLPFTTVTAGAADYVVRTAVKLFCPGYTSRTN
jgi:hypothetical protein